MDEQATSTSGAPPAHGAERSFLDQIADAIYPALKPISEAIDRLGDRVARLENDRIGQAEPQPDLDASAAETEPTSVHHLAPVPADDVPAEPVTGNASSVPTGHPEETR